MDAHIHVNAAAGANGSVAIPLFQSPFVGLPGATTTGLIAASALMPAVFVGPLEVLPDYNNVDVATTLAQYITPGLAYAQVCPALPCCCALAAPVTTVAAASYATINIIPIHIRAVGCSMHLHVESQRSFVTSMIAY